jgi:hypothetical protein
MVALVIILAVLWSTLLVVCWPLCAILTITALWSFWPWLTGSRKLLCVTCGKRHIYRNLNDDH